MSKRKRYFTVERSDTHELLARMRLWKFGAWALGLAVAVAALTSGQLQLPLTLALVLFGLACIANDSEF